MVIGASHQFRFDVILVAALFEFERQLLAAAAHDPAAGHHMHRVRHDIFEQALIMGDDEEAALFACARH